MTWLIDVINAEGELCRNCLTVWRTLSGREIEKCANCGDEAFDAYDFADDGPNPYDD